ncbi:MAG: hypothetical protein ACTSQ4_02190 [Candidatus Heimdallarchaeaceae archaeon]
MADQKVSVKLSKRLRDFLDKNSTNKRQTYEDVIWVLLGTKTLTKDQRAECISAYEGAL